MSDPRERTIGTTDPPPFSIDGPLPEPGLTVIEASAGTGKTWTLTSLVVRFVAEGMDLSEILAVTFTRMATGELRDRIRRRLVEAHDGLTAVSSGAAGGGDPLVAVLASAGEEEAQRRAVRLAVALADFDAATIATTHGFCQMVLHGLGSAGDAAADSVLLEDPRDLVREVVDDLYLRRCVASGPLPFGPADARKAADAAVKHADTPIFEYPPGGAASALAVLAGAAREEVTRRLVAEDQLTYDEMLTRLARTLDDPGRGPEAALRLSRRYRVVLVDEFQDTDPVQWRIVRSAFARPGSGNRLVLIGDPKQAIYAFRGADVHAYLQAAAEADASFTLGECRRSDQPLLDAISALFEPTLFGHAGIPFRPVAAPPGRETAGLRGAALRLRVVSDHEPAIVKTKSGYHQKDSLVAWVAADLSADVEAFLAGAPTVPDGAGGARRLVAADVAVLTRANKQAQVVRDALRARGVPAVLAGTDDVFGSEAARAWLVLLGAIQEPTSRSRLSALALSPFVGLSASQVAGAGDEEWEALHGRVTDWAGVLAGRGVGALYRRVSAVTGLPGRVLAVDGGERTITDLGHVAELLHSEAGAGQLGPASLRTWLAARIRATGDEEADIEERSRRLDSDAAAVQVLTVHRAKGLEFDVVYCPFLWDASQAEGGGGAVVYHDPETGSRVLDTGCSDRFGPEAKLYKDHSGWASIEDQGESLRLMYVALTRARHQVVVWWGQGYRSGTSPLGRVLLCRDPARGEVGPARVMQPDESMVVSALRSVRDRASSGAVALEGARVRPPAGSGGGGEQEPPPDLERARFERRLDQSWRRASYTSITAGAHRAGEVVGSEPEEEGITDEPAQDPAAGAAAIRPLAAGPATPSQWADLAGGAAVGTFVHRTLELADFAGQPLATELRSALERAGRFGRPDIAIDGLAVALESALTTPLGGPLGDTALESIGRADRLDELGFELPVAGGDRPSGAVTTAALAGAIGRHLGPGDRMALYPPRLAEPALASVLRGYLVGSLDLVFRRPGSADPAGPVPWYVVDYKTNWLGSTCEDYGPAELDEEMRHRHYPLQALLYMVALHRYLGWRLPGYRPEEQLGGVYYLFLRGMAGPGTPSVGGHRCGVFHWPVPPALVVELSDLLDGPAGGR